MKVKRTETHGNVHVAQVSQFSERILAKKKRIRQALFHFFFEKKTSRTPRSSRELKTKVMSRRGAVCFSVYLQALIALLVSHGVTNVSLLRSLELPVKKKTALPSLVPVKTNETHLFPLLLLVKKTPCLCVSVRGFRSVNDAHLTEATSESRLPVKNFAFSAFL